MLKINPDKPVLFVPDPENVWCDFCSDSAARSEEDWQRRHDLFKSGPEITPAHCPVCGGIKWATTRDMIEEVPEEQGKARLGLMVLLVGIAFAVCFLLIRLIR